MKKRKVRLYKVTYHETDTTDYKTEIMDSNCLFWLNLDWAFEIDGIEPPVRARPGGPATRTKSRLKRDLNLCILTIDK
jgi:hypothetical protein